MKNLSKLIAIASIALNLLFFLYPSQKAKAQYPEGEIEYYNSVFSSENGKIKSFGETTVEYYSSVFSSENGKVKSIGDIRVEYYSSVFNSENGKVKSVDGVGFEYYNSVFSYENGKLKSIGNIRFEYDDKGRIKSRSKGDSASLQALKNYRLVEMLNNQ